MNCPNCGADIPEASKFCPQCGNEIKKETQSDDLMTDEKRKTAQSQKTANKGKQKIWIIIASIVLIVLVVVLFVTLTRSHQMEQQKTASRADTSAAISQSRKITETASSRAYYIDDSTTYSR